MEEKRFQSFRERRAARSQVQRSRRFSRKVKVIVVLLSVVALVMVGWALWSSASSVARFVFPANPIKKTDDRVNVLLLGIGGGKHDGPMLTDSIIVASFNTKTKKVVLISVPRDLWLASIKEKVNAAYEVGVQHSDGLRFAEDKLDDILGIPIHYGILMDFSAFSRAIDLVDGVDVEVTRTFDDYEYPIEGKEDDLCDYHEQEMDISGDQAKELNIAPGKQKVLLEKSGKIATDSSKLDLGCRYEQLHFNRGLMHMDGVTALKFVRSRHGTNNEGSDFARSKRQQLVIDAFKSKILSIGTFANPQKVFGLLDTFGSSVKTDIPKERFLEFYNMAKSVKEIDSVVLGDLGNGKSVFVNPPVTQYGAWVLVPPEEDFSPVVDLVKKALEGTAAGVLVPRPSPSGK